MHDCCEPAKLCAIHLDGLWKQLKGVAAVRGEVWRPGDLAAARLRVRDLSSDPELREMLAKECLRWARKARSR